MPSCVCKDEAERILETLRQLCARLYAWCYQADRFPPTSSQRKPQSMAPETDLLLKRRVLIRRFVEARQSGTLRLSDLAHELGVSEDRASHLVRECCGESFRNILIQTRIKTARELLQFSSLPILEIALASGFTEITHFNRLFRAKVGMTPSKYREL